MIKDVIKRNKLKEPPNLDYTKEIMCTSILFGSFLV